MNIPYHHLANLVFNRPLFALPRAAQIASGVLLRRIDAAAQSGSRALDDVIEVHDASNARTPRASEFLGEWRRNEDGSYKPYLVTGNGTAIITMVGDLVNRGAWIGADCGMISYDGLKAQFIAAAQDESITDVVLDMESPGGEAVGCMEAAAVQRDLAAIKPVIAVVNGMAASAMYALASGATRIVSIPSGISGSIGVVMLHLNLAAYLEKEGVQPTLIHAGAHKVDGNPFEALPDDVRADFQREVELFYSLFVATVVAGRPGLSEEAVRATEARTYIGEEARAAGLVDEIGTIEEVIVSLQNPQSRAALLGRAA